MLGLGASTLGYRDDFLTLAFPCTPSLDFHIGRGLLRRCLRWASRGPIDAPCGPFVFICTRYPHTQESWGHPLVSADFFYIFLGIYWALEVMGKPEIRKWQKTEA